MQGDYEAALAITLKKLRTSDRFESEVRGWLHDSSPDVVDRVLMFLREHRMLNDVRAAESVSRKRGSHGSLRLEQELRQRGADESAIAAVLPSRDEEYERLLSALTKKFSPQDDRAKGARFLYSRGFPEDMIASAIERYFEVAD
jgi:SOS response regulatory protein OraA/RecX